MYCDIANTLEMPLAINILSRNVRKTGKKIQLKYLRKLSYFQGIDKLPSGCKANSDMLQIVQFLEPKLTASF